MAFVGDMSSIEGVSVNVVTEIRLLYKIAKSLKTSITNTWLVEDNEKYTLEINRLNSDASELDGWT